MEYVAFSCDIIHLIVSDMYTGKGIGDRIRIAKVYRDATRSQTRACYNLMRVMCGKLAMDLNKHHFFQKIEIYVILSSSHQSINNVSSSMVRRRFRA